MKNKKLLYLLGVLAVVALIGFAFASGGKNFQGSLQSPFTTNTTKTPGPAQPVPPSLSNLSVVTYPNNPLKISFKYTLTSSNQAGGFVNASVGVAAAGGATVKSWFSQPAAKGTNQIDWDTKNNQGNLSQAGAYTFKISLPNQNPLQANFALLGPPPPPLGPPPAPCLQGVTQPAPPPIPQPQANILNVTVDSSTPVSQQFTAGSTNQKVLVLKLTNNDSKDLFLKKIRFTVTDINLGNVDIAISHASRGTGPSPQAPIVMGLPMVWLDNGNNPGYVEWVNNNPLDPNNPYIKKGATLYEFLYVNFTSSSQQQVSGLDPQFELGDLQVTDVNGNSAFVYNGGAVGNQMVVYNTRPAFSVSLDSPCGASAGSQGMRIFKFDVAADNNTADPAINKVILKSIKLTTTKAGVSVNNVKIYPVVPVNHDYDNNATYATACVPDQAKTQWFCTLNQTSGTNEVIEGMTNSYIVRADVGSSSGSYNTLVTSISSPGSINQPGDVLWSDDVTPSIGWVSQFLSAYPILTFGANSGIFAP